MKTRTTTDTYTGKRFEWNDTVRWADYDLIAPSRLTRSATYDLHPTRVPVRLLQELNPGINVVARLESRRTGRPDALTRELGAIEA